MLKTRFTSLFLLLAVTTSFVFAEFDENGLDLDKIAVRIILNCKGGVHDKSDSNEDVNGDVDKGNSNNSNYTGNVHVKRYSNGNSASAHACCTKEEHDILTDVLVNSVLVSDASKRQLRQGRKTLSCHLLCKGFYYGHCKIVYPQCAPRRKLVSLEQEPRLLESNVLSTAANNKCSTMKKSIEDKIDAILSQGPGLVSKPCMNLLGMSYKIACPHGSQR